jgi:ubiquinone/menaquinone biosynthesis C-methylase UbiE
MTMNLQFDSEVSRQVESVYITPDVIEQRRVVRAALALRPGEHVLDIGVGPGLLAAEMAAEVGPGGRVCGIDISDSMLAIAATRAQVAGGAVVELRSGDANHIPYADDDFDVAVSTQVFEYVEDLPGALAEVRRVLRPGGRLLLLDTDWDSIVWHSSDEERMERVLDVFEEHLVDPHLPRTLRGSLERAGFAVAAPRILPLFNVGYEPATYSAGVLEIIAGFAAGRDGLTPEEANAWAEDLRSLGPDYFFSINRYLFQAAMPRAARPRVTGLRRCGPFRT